MPEEHTGSRKPKARYFINSSKFVAGLSDLPDFSIKIPTKFDPLNVKKVNQKSPLILNERVVFYVSDRKDRKFYKIAAYRGERFAYIPARYLPAFILHKKICDNPSLVGYKKHLHRELVYEFLLLTGVKKFVAAIIAAFLCSFKTKEKK